MRRIDDTHRVFGLVAVAVAAALVVAGSANGSADAHGVAPRLLRQETQLAAEAKVAPARKVRVVYSGPFVSQGVETERSVPEREAPVRSGASQLRAEEPAVTGSIPAGPEPRVQVAALDPKPSERGARTADTAAKSGIDLNTASIEELNALGGGRIGKAIARRRPYASPEDLLDKRVINRATFARIRDQITVQ